MATNRMMELAFRYKETKLWQRMYDTELFAVRLSDGEIGYCSVMGRMGDHNALGLYVGDEGFRSYCFLLNTPYGLLDDRAMGEMLTSQSCLQCSFETKDMLSEEELQEVRRYAKRREKPLRGKNAFPQFTKYQPGRYPWHFDTKLDNQRICEALEAAIELDGLLRRHGAERLGLVSLEESGGKIPLLVSEKDGWVVQSVPLPSGEMVYPEPVFANEVLAARLRRKKKKGVWECGTMRIPTPVQDEQDDEAPYFPLALLCVDRESELVQRPVVSNGDDAAELLLSFAEMLLDAPQLPKTFCCGDERSYALLKDLGAKIGILVKRTEESELLDETMEDLLDHMGEDEDEDPDVEKLESLIEMLAEMPESELAQVPPEMSEILLEFAELDVLPKPLAKRLKKLFR